MNYCNNSIGGIMIGNKILHVLYNILFLFWWFLCCIRISWINYSINAIFDVGMLMIYPSMLASSAYLSVLLILFFSYFSLYIAIIGFSWSFPSTLIFMLLSESIIHIAKIGWRFKERIEMLVPTSMNVQLIQYFH